MIHSRALLVAATILIYGCAWKSPIPEGYDGPLASIVSSELTQGGSKAEIFHLKKVGDVRVRDARVAARQASYGQGFSLTTEPVVTMVPARMNTFFIEGRTIYGAPIQELLSTIYRVQGEVTFTPEEGKEYIVKGSLGPEYSGVWIEERHTGELVGDKVEVHGESKLNFFQK